MAFLSHRYSNYWRLFAIFIFICLISISSTVSYTITATIEAPFVQESTSRFDYLGVETFNTIPAGTYPKYTTNFGRGANSEIQGTYYDLQIRDRSVFGGAGKNGTYPACPLQGSYRLVLSQAGQRGVNYFGLWLSALDLGNRFEFYYQGTKISTWGTQDVIDLVNTNNDYNGNPTFTAEANINEPFVFMNFYFNDIELDEVKFSQPASSGEFESDNHSVGYFTSQSGTVISTTAPTITITTTTTTTTTMTTTTTTTTATATTTTKPGGVSLLVAIGAVVVAVALLAVIIVAVYAAVSWAAGAPSSSPFEEDFDIIEGPEHGAERDVGAGVSGEGFA